MKHKVDKQTEGWANVIRNIHKGDKRYIALMKVCPEDDWEETGKLIEKYNIMLTPCLAIKHEGKKNWWSAGKMSLGVAGNTNHVQYQHLAFGCTPHEAVKNAVEKYKSSKKRIEKIT